MARKNGGAYASRGGAEVGGGVIPIMCWPCVDDRAVELAEGVVRSMLRGAPSAVTARMVAHECKVGIIGRRQVTTDIPCHGHLKGTTTSDGRDFDAGTQGLGGVPGCATTTVGEENVTMDDDDGYCAESILVHEFGHAGTCRQDTCGLWANGCCCSDELRVLGRASGNNQGTVQRCDPCRRSINNST